MPTQFSYLNILTLFLFYLSLVASSPSAAAHETGESSQFAQVFEKHSAIMLIIDPKTGQVLAANRAAIRFYGYSATEFLNLSIQQINMLNAEQVASERALAKSENRNYFIFRHQLKSGDEKTVAVNSVPITFHGEAVLFSIIQDITTQREIQKDLWHYQSNLEKMVDNQVSQIDQAKRLMIHSLVWGVAFLLCLVAFLLYLLKRKRIAEEQRSALAQIVEQSPVSIITTDANGIITFANEHFFKTSAFNLEDVIGRHADILRDDGHNIALYEDLWNTIKLGKPWSGELHTHCDNGDVHWERANIYPLINSNNTISSYVAIKEDITKQKQHEKQLKQASTVFKTATEAVVITDKDFKIIAVNDAFSSITGFDKDDVIGTEPSFLHSEYHEEAFYQQMNKELHEAGQWQGEVCNSRRTGELFYEWLSITLIKDDNENVESYVCLFTDITKRKKAEQAVYQQANFDVLTGLANRNLFIDRFEYVLELAKRKETSVALFFIDLDRFKNVNDTFGHNCGDMLLKQVAARLLSSVRKSDTVTRLSGDEFAIIIFGNDDLLKIENLALKILDKLASAYQLDDKEAFITASIGIAMSPGDGSTSEELLRKADSAMYKAKEKGKNNVQFFTKEMDDVALQRRTLESALRHSITNNQLEVHYQPIHDSHTGKVSSAEALVRWHHPMHGMISPDKFIPLAEDNGFINDIGEWVLEQACIEAKKWHQQYQDAPKVSVNISSVQFYRQDFVAKLATILERVNLAPQLLILEMTESLLIEEDSHTLDQLTRIREMGVQLSIDDFGTGYSSLSYLKRFPVNILKIDRAFIKDITDNPEDEGLTAAIISIAHNLKLKVVAEGVEAQEQCQLLAKYHCHYLQGYYFSKPLIAAKFDEYLAKQPFTIKE
ncbi:EAL domain-containing protein [Psychrobium sp. 1_MG-2023]|uniref:sensor domain-containing protein n=1 Tax=Psychrobium sp. 1_MG-2023 TaxID=3062624 RepID=UPI000C3392C7|nr:EAL domain-containing protein [Psychrobium sp. 1_MG-2023]MDP2561702.1 EAL domain-containing protein [Psychrobium sp. 1_MG-2023]PKF57103.1 GGDEF domain-containing protein [Alteromonadales bacterium alter-6D02]